MDIIESSIAFSIEELSFLRQVIDLSTISAKDAKFVAQLQIKIEHEVQQIHHMKNDIEAEKQKQLEEIKSSSRKKSL